MLALLPNSSLSFTLVGPKTYDAEEEFLLLLDKLKKHSSIRITPEDVNVVRLSLEGQSSTLLAIEKPTDSLPDDSMKRAVVLRLTTARDEELAFRALRVVVFNHHPKYKMFSDDLAGPIPNVPWQIPLLFRGLVDSNRVGVLREEGLIAKFFVSQSGSIYASNDAGEFFIVNPVLLDYIVKLDPPQFSKSELYRKVAPNLESFSQLADCGLLADKFYEHEREGSRIINRSGMNLENPGRKVFIKPHIHEISGATADPFRMMDPKLGREFLRMDKIRKGESLETALIRFLSKELEIADDFIGAIVSPEIEFDLDRDGIATPRVVVKVIVEKIRNKEWFEQAAKTGWNSIGQQSPKINVHRRLKDE